MGLYFGLPKTFWTDAVNIAVYIINWAPLVPLEYRMPGEVWSGKEERLAH